MRIYGWAWGALLGLTGAAQAAPGCDVAALNGLRVADLRVTEAKLVPPAGITPGYCDVHGTVVTKGGQVGAGLARFAMQLPEHWERRFLFLGVGGNAGNLVPSANPTDRAAALGKGYATVLTDTGHEGDGTSAKWTVTADGAADTVKRIDFFHRAAHNVTVAGKALAAAYYAAKVEHAYFDGCSTGGRMALMEAERYPEDYDGVISGDPMMSFHTYTARAVVQRAALASATAYIPPATLAAIDARVTGQCDALDGAKDGLVQDPTACRVRAEDLLCKAGDSAACLNPAQMRVLQAYTSTFRDPKGRVVFGPWALTDLAGAQGVAYNVTGRAAPDLADLSAPWKADAALAPRSWALVQEMVTYWLRLGPKASVADLDLDPARNVVGAKMLALMNATYSEGNVRDAARLKRFLAQGRKLILYHGASDPSIPSSQSVAFYQELAGLHQGLTKTQQSARLFLVPGMHHCGGGPGPDQFDTLSAMANWVEHGVAPAAIVARTKPEVAARHGLLLCPYPQQGRYSGTGDMQDPANWACAAAGAKAG